MRSRTSARGQQAVLLVVAAVVAGCGTFVESNDQVARGTVGQSGGALKLDAFSIAVPADSLDHTVTLSVSRAAFDAPSGHAFTVDPADVVFATTAPATISIAYDAAVYQHPSEVFVAMLTGATWHMQPAAGTAEAGVAHASTTHTGTFGVVVCPGGVCPTSTADAGADH